MGAATVAHNTGHADNHGGDQYDKAENNNH
jgi:hypothetical protein